MFRSFSLITSAVVLGSLSGSTALQSNDLYEAREPIPSEFFLPRPGKRVACFLTINSTNEKRTFTKYLNPAEWDLVEFVPSDDRSHASWFDRACAKKINCDIDVISGHFAGKFFGESGFELKLGELETHGCAKDCDGILRNPKEVYMFGCNTLAGKEKDSRTPDEYYGILVNQEHYSPDVTRMVVEDRYSPFGQDNRGKMQRAFSGVPYLYGFWSKSPLGAHVQPLLETYLKRIGDFSKHIDEIEEKKLYAKSTPNQLIQGLLQSSNFYQCSGLDVNDPAYEDNLKICRLANKSIPLADRLRLAGEMMESDHVISLLPSLENFIQSNIRDIKTNEPALFATLESNANAKKILLDSIHQAISPIVKVEWMRFAHMMSWISRDDLIHNVYQVVADAFSQKSFTTEAGNTICDLGVSSLAEMDFTALIPQLRDDHFRSTAAIQAMTCTGLARYPLFKSRLNQMLGSMPSSSATTFLISSVFSNVPAVLSPDSTDLALLEKLKRQCRLSPDSTSIRLCPRALARLGSSDTATTRTLIDDLKNANAETQGDLAQAYTAVSAGLGELEDAMLDVYLDPRQPYWWKIEAYFLAHPVENPANQAKIWDYLLNRRPDGRRPDEMVYALRDSKLSVADAEKNFWALRKRPAPLITGRVLNGFLEIANTAKAGQPFVETLMTEHSQVTFTSDEDLVAFYRALKLPVIASIVKKSPVAQGALCTLMKAAALTVGYDDLGDVSEHSVVVKDCRTLIREL